MSNYRVYSHVSIILTYFIIYWSKLNCSSSSRTQDQLLSSMSAHLPSASRPLRPPIFFNVAHIPSSPFILELWRAQQSVPMHLILLNHRQRLETNSSSLHVKTNQTTLSSLKTIVTRSSRAPQSALVPPTTSIRLLFLLLNSSSLQIKTSETTLSAFKPRSLSQGHQEH